MTGATVAAAIRDHERKQAPPASGEALPAIPARRERGPKRPCVVCGRGCPYTVVDVCSARCEAKLRGLEPDESKVEQPNSVEAPRLCHWCGSDQPYIEGDDVHPGYDGPPVCPECKGS